MVNCFSSKSILDEFHQMAQRIGYVNSKQSKSLVRKGIKRDYVIPEPHRIGVDERKNSDSYRGVEPCGDSKFAYHVRTEAVSTVAMFESGTQETNITAGTQDHDSDSEVDEQVIGGSSFLLTDFAAYSSSNGPSCYGNAIAGIKLAMILLGGVSVVSTSASGSIPAGGNPAGSLQPAGLPYLVILGSSENVHDLPVPFLMCGMDQLSSGIFNLPLCDDFSATLFKFLAPAVKVAAMQDEMQKFIKPENIRWMLRVPLSMEKLEEVYVTQAYKVLEDPLLPKACVQKCVKALYWTYQALEPGVDEREFDMSFAEFEMSAMGEMTFFLGLQVKQLPDGIFISQDKYVKDMLTKFDMESVRTATTPYEAAKTKLKDETDPPVNVHLYRSMIGSLMYLTASRPDIMFAVSACSRHQVTPLTSHLNAVKKIFKYLKGQPKLGLWYPKDSPFQLEAYSDSDYAGSHGDRKSTTGGCQFLGRRLISWQCKKQTIVATSSTEAEYVAAASCCAQVLWIQNQLLDYGFNFMNTKIFIDNQSTICIVKNPVFHQRTKHIEIRHHFIRDANEKNLIQVLKIHTDDNVADLLTKAFDGPRFEYLVVHIGMVVNTAASCTFFLLTGWLLLAESIHAVAVVYAVNTSIYAAELVCAGSIMFLLADLFLLVVTCFCYLNLVFAVLRLILLVVSNHAGLTMYLLTE
ncbi:hypothetical protein Tco_0270346 [Tanacetum coccineum]